MRRDAVVVGIDLYAGNPLYGCRNDAASIADCLSLDEYGFDCTSLLDGDATRASILDALGRLIFRSVAERQGTLVFYFAGHGQVLGRDGYLVTIDAQMSDPGISLGHLSSLIESAADVYEHVVVILDSCHSGAAYSWSTSRPLRNTDIERDIQAVNESRCVLAACRPEQFAEESNGQGVFTATLVRGLLGDAANALGETTVHSLYDFVSSGMKSKEGQLPVFKGDIAGTVILGTGFPVNPPDSITSNRDVSKLVAKGRSLLDNYEIVSQRELADPGYRDRIGLRNCARELEGVAVWFADSQRGNGHLAGDDRWLSMVDELRNCIAGVTPVKLHQNSISGVLSEKLGTGGFGNVWRVDEEGRSRAYKIFHSSELHDEVKVQRFRNGFENMRKLEHPRIVQVESLTTAPLGIVMEFVEGANLRNYFVDSNDAAACLRLVLEIADTVNHAHSRGVKHRDIKPENIIIRTADDGTPIPHLTDFDLAYHQTNRTVTATYGVGGVLNYAAPEQLHNPTALSARSPVVDIYSLAQLMFFIITNEDPVSDDQERNNVKFARTLNRWADPRAVEIVRDLYQKSTERDASLRPQEMQEFVAAIVKADAYTNAATRDERMSEERFLSQLAHALVGLGNYSTTSDSVSMSSLSGQVSVIIRSKGRSVNTSDRVDVEFELSVTGMMTLAAVSSGQQSRKQLNSKLDRLLSRYPGTERHPGNKGTFQTYVVMRRIPLSIEGVVEAGEVLAACVGCVDGA